MNLGDILSQQAIYHIQANIQGNNKLNNQIYPSTSHQLNIHLNLTTNEHIPSVINDLAKQEKLGQVIDFNQDIIPSIQILDKKQCHSKCDDNLLPVDHHVKYQLDLLDKQLLQNSTINYKFDESSSSDQNMDEIQLRIKSQQNSQQLSNIQVNLPEEDDNSIDENQKLLMIRQSPLLLLQDELNKNLKQIIENKREEWNYLADEQLKEIDRARHLNQSEKDKQLIIERHLRDIHDWMTNAQIQIQNNKNQLVKHFWKEWHNEQNQNVNNEYELIECQKIRISQGIVKKQEVDLIISLKTPSINDFHRLVPINNLLFPNNNNVSSQIQTQNPTSTSTTPNKPQIQQVNNMQQSQKSLQVAMLNFCYYEDFNDQQQERVNKYIQFSEITAIEDNFPLIVRDSKLKYKLINDNEMVYESFSQQIKSAVQQLKDDLESQKVQVNKVLSSPQQLAADEEQEIINIFTDKDCLYTQHSNLSIVDTLCTCLINMKFINKTQLYLQHIYSQIKLANHYGFDVLIIPFDFIIYSQIIKIEGKYQKMIQKSVQTIKQALYEMAIDNQSHQLKSIVFSLELSNNMQNSIDVENRQKIGDLILKTIGNLFN
eukprot:403359948